MGAIITRTGVSVSGEQAKVCVNIGIAKWEQDIEEILVLTAKKIAERINTCKTVEELQVYKSDKRQVAKLAYGKKLKELKQ